MSKNISNKDNSQANVPDLDDLITHITSNGNFKTMMDSLSGGLNEKTNVVKEEEENVNEVSDELDVNEGISDNNNLDLLSTFFTDSSGNNIADILTNINNNLSQISKSLSSK